ncbi:MAG: PhoX family protein, partial [Actinomycetota bacterium]|nr:PhoX family protein [Actinomycetota bacterium]
PRTSLNDAQQWLALPQDFVYTIFSKTGSEMSDGRPAPRSHDGMGAFGSSRTGVKLIRNQEIRFSSSAPYTQGVFTIEAAANAYDKLAEGGNTTLTFDARRFLSPSGGLVQDYVSLTGTVVNCAGGLALRKSGWLTCEEIVQQELGSEPPGSVPRTERKHGYVYLNPLDGTSPGNPVGPSPFVAMGRFAHEAATVDPRTGIVYQTEDAGSGRGSGFYRFLPRNPADLSRGGVLQILGIQNMPSADLREGQEQGRSLPVRWYTVWQPNPGDDAPNAVFEEAYSRGAAKFNRLEGCWDGAGSIFFASTSGGDVKNGDVNSDGFAEGYGQIWEYIPDGLRGGQLVLLFESPDGDVLDSPDNIVVSPRGGLVLCEDDASTVNAGQDDTSPFFGEDKNRLIGLTLDGMPFPFAENIMNDSEFAGACWSEDGAFLFVNIFGYDEAGTGGTLAITGPWQRGAL